MSGGVKSARGDLPLLAFQTRRSFTDFLPSLRYFACLHERAGRRIRLLPHVCRAPAMTSDAVATVATNCCYTVVSLQGVGTATGYRCRTSMQNSDDDYVCALYLARYTI